MLRRSAFILFVAFFAFLFLPLAIAPRHAPPRVAVVPHTESLIQLAPIVVNELLLPRVLDAQAVAVDSVPVRDSLAVPERSGSILSGHSALFWIGVAILVAAIGFFAWRWSQRTDWGDSDTRGRGAT